MGFEDKVTVENVNEQDEQGNTRLHESMRFGRLKEVKSLMDLGADSMMVNKDGFTAQEVSSKTFMTVMDNMEEIRKELDELNKKLDELKEKPELDEKEKEAKEYYQSEKSGRLVSMATKKEVLLRWREISSIVTPKADDELTARVDKEIAKIEASAKAKMEERRAAIKAGRPTLEQANISGDKHVQSADGNVKATPGGGSPRSVTSVGIQ
jgi:hypothetical protein